MAIGRGGPEDYGSLDLFASASDGSFRSLPPPDGGGLPVVAPDEQAPGEPLAAFAGDIEAEAGDRRWWFRRLTRNGAALAVGPRQAWIWRSVVVDDAGGLS